MVFRHFHLNLYFKYFIIMIPSLNLIIIKDSIILEKFLLELFYLYLNFIFRNQPLETFNGSFKYFAIFLSILHFIQRFI